MSSLTREIAKFLAGVAAEEAMVHWALGFSEVLPIKILGFAVTPTFNTISMVAWPLVAFVLIYYAWMRKRPD